MLNNRVLAKDNIPGKNKGNSTTNRSSGFTNTLGNSNDNKGNLLNNSNVNNSRLTSDHYCSDKNINMKGSSKHDDHKDYVTKKIKVEFNPGIFENMVQNMNKVMNYEKKMDNQKNNMLNYNDNMIKKGMNKINNLGYNKKK